jgi:serine protease inhibitor
MLGSATNHPLETLKLRRIAQDHRLSRKGNTMKRPAHFGSDDLDLGTEDLVQGNNAFALDLYARIRTGTGNLFVSPYSISSALALTYAGARGKTAGQMARALRFSVDQEPFHGQFAALEASLRDVAKKGKIRLRTANRLWPRTGYDLLDDYVRLLKACYGVTIQPLDYRDTEAARTAINRWVEKQTEDRIENLIHSGDLSPETLLVLVNAIYFKGDWASQFEPALTRDAPFWVGADKSVAVRLMTQTQTFRWGGGREFQMLEMPYDGGDLSMFVLLPAARDGLPELEAALTLDNLHLWASQLRERQVQVQLPRFKLDYRFIVNSALSAMGMIDAFSAGTADFSGIAGEASHFFIDLIAHQAFVQVDEAGTEAAAATAILERSLPPAFRANHPFVFLIRENNSGSILFMGRLADPAV